MAKAYAFDEPGLKRVIAAVRRIEHTIANPSGGGGTAGGYSGEWLPFRNNAGETVPGYSVIGIASSEADNLKSLHLVGAKPSTTFLRTYAITSPVDVASSQYGLATTVGKVEVKYDTGTPAIGETWGPKPAQFTLSKSYSGFRVLGITDTTNKIMLVEPEPVAAYLGKADGAIAVAASGTVDIWIGTAGSETNSTVEITGCYNRTTAIASGDWVTVTYLNGQPYVALLTC